MVEDADGLPFGCVPPEHVVLHDRRTHRPEVPSDIGVDKILWESDYPHADTTWPYAQKAAQELMVGVPDDEVEAITHGNALKLFDWEMPSSLASA